MTFNQGAKICDYSQNNRCNQPLRQDPDEHVYARQHSEAEYQSHKGISYDNKLASYDKSSGYGNRRRSGEMVHSVHSDVPLYQYRGPYSEDYLSGSTRPAGYNVANNGPHSGEFGKYSFNCPTLTIHTIADRFRRYFSDIFGNAVHL